MVARFCTRVIACLVAVAGVTTVVTVVDAQRNDTRTVHADIRTTASEASLDVTWGR
ncbi:hypothetical protein [Streptomyces sp. MUM 2J]|uniref:hypothetical protein n=1 Tax=Streptomyces sp. MUM 2J TaxID=2791987 RepID=UPI001F046ED5|nr:hypothetical protein [Streptomyces sp. MUM 2J]MCH0566831.1 hypothetical protein [Streptomyces sp. MUM 2J]MCH0570237.1 hypothetical protein [Streptomyces sp. MUM 136J]